MHKNMLLNKFLQFLLLEIIIMSIIYNLLPGFKVNSKLYLNLRIIILLSSIILIILNLCFFSIKSSLISLPCIFTVLLVSTIIFHKQLILLFNSKNFEANYSIYFIILIATIICFGASKLKSTFTILFAATILIFAALSILHYKTNWLFLIIFLISSCIFYSFKFYCDSIKFTHAQKIMPIKYVFICCIFCFITIGISFGIYSILSSNPIPVKNPSFTSNKTFLNLGKKYGFATLVKAPPQTKNYEHKKIPLNNPSNKVIKKSTALNENINLKANSPKNNNIKKSYINQKKKSPKKIHQKKLHKVRAITYFRKWSLLYFLPVIIIFLIVGSFLIKALLRKLWYKKLLNNDINFQIIKLYNNCLRILSVFGYKRSSNTTPNEFAIELCDGYNFNTLFENYDFKKITHTFTDANYGNIDIKNEDYNEMLSFNKNLLKYCKKDAGLFKFTFKYLIV